MTYMHRGIEVRDGQYEWVNITNNRIEARDRGIFAYNNSGYFKEISNNLVEMDLNPLSVGVDIQDALAPIAPFATWAVYNNTVNLTNARYGIFTQAGGSQAIRNNEVNLKNANYSGRTGIRMSGGQHNSITCNYVGGEGAPMTFVDNTGIYTDASPLAEVSCNSVDYTATGIQFWGMSIPTRVGTNDMANHGKGLLYGLHPSEGNAFTGDQDHTGNLWSILYQGGTSTPGQNGAMHFGSSPQVIFQSEYIYDDAPNPSYGFTVFTPNAPTADWFKYYPGTNADCSIVQSNCDEVGRPWYTPLAPSGEDESIAQGGLATDGHTDGLLYTAQRQLYRRWLQWSGLTSTVVDSFALAVGNTSIGQREGFLIDLAQEVFPQGSILDELADVETALVEITDSLVTVQLAIATCQTNCGGLMQEATDLRVVLDSLARSWEALVASTRSARSQAIAQLQSDLSNLTSTNVPEQLESQVWSIWLDRLASDSTHLTPAQITTLEGIATTCPLDGGEAVYMARAMLSRYTISTYDDFTLCDPAMPRSSEGYPLDGKGLTVFPNPSTGTFTLKLANTGQIPERITVLDALGQMVYQAMWAPMSFNHLLNLSGLHEGIYVVRLTDVNGQVIGSDLLQIAK